MPAHRSRTERWRECLHQIYERNGGLEIAVSRGEGVDLPPGSPRGVDLVWRVRILGLTDAQILLETPMTLNQSVPIPTGTMLTVALVVGQNRWMFRAPVLGTARVPSRVGPGASALTIAMPQAVERCMRREFMRVSTASLNLPEVEVFPLLDQSTVFAAEIAARGLATRLEDERRAGKLGRFDPMDQVLPTVGPMFKARLLNLGGGGAGLLVPKTERGSVDTSRPYWMRIDLRPEVGVPLSLAAKVVHTHLDSEQNTYCGSSFEFATPEHRAFVASQIVRFSERVQSGSTQIAA
ncbi:MAG: flagellar brake protein [Tepidisphaera sp.]